MEGGRGRPEGAAREEEGVGSPDALRAMKWQETSAFDDVYFNTKAFVHKSTSRYARPST